MTTGFRRFVIGIAEFFQVLSIFGATMIGGYLGYALAQIYNASPYNSRSEIFIGSMPARDFLFVLIGALGAFVVTATLAAILFTFSQIERNTRGMAIAYRLGDEQTDPVNYRKTPKF